MTRMNTTAEENKALVHRLVDEVINGNRLDVVDELFSAELAAPVHQGFVGFRAAFPDWHEEIVDLVAEDDKIAARFKCTGTLKGEFMGVKPNGKKTSVAEVFFMKVRDGRIVEYWGLEDNLGRMQQLDADTGQ